MSAMGTTALPTTKWHKRLVTQAVALQLAIVACVLAVLSIAFARFGEASLREQYGLRALSVAESVAEVPEIQSALAGGEIEPEVQKIAESVRLRTGVSFVSIGDTQGVRHSHPNPDRIGKKLSTDPSRALAGIADWYVQVGTLGESVRGKAPIWDPTGEEVVGIVSVGVLTETIDDEVRADLARLLLWAGGAFLGAAVAVYFATRRIRNQTLGLEPPEIAAMYEHRDGMLRALNEGVLAIDREGVVTLLNQPGGRLLGIEGDQVGRPLVDRPGLQPLLDLARPESTQVDVPVRVGANTLLVSTSPITVRGKWQGAVFTLRDRTELRTLVSELESAQGLIDALRAQAHEHANNLHTIAGLIELDRHQDVLAIVEDHGGAQRNLTDLYRERAGADSMIVAALLAKAAIATERDIALHTHIGALPMAQVSVMRDLVTIVGNLVDNAIDHLSEHRGGPKEIEVAVWTDQPANDDTPMTHIEVSDSGAGLDPTVAERAFEPGITTKDPRSHDGLGLSLIDDIVTRYGGTIRVDSDAGSGTLFSIQLRLTPSRGREAALADV